MGQQQLLLIILAAIVVGIAIIVGITVFPDNAVEHNRALVIADLKSLATRAVQYYNRPTTLGGGSKSFGGLTANARGIGLLAGVKYTDNANGTYTIKTAGNATQVVLHGVGKVEMSWLSVICYVCEIYYLFFSQHPRPVDNENGLVHNFQPCTPPCFPCFSINDGGA